MPPKQTKVLTKRRKFIDVEIPLTRTKIELIGNSIKDIENRTVKLDLTRQLKGKSVEAVFKIKIEGNKAFASPEKIKLMPYFIRRMIRKRISYVEDSFIIPSQESMLIVKPFLITRKRVSKAVRKTLRNKCKNWIEDYIAERKNNEIFSEILTNRMQKPLSLYLKKTYPLSLCEIRIIEIVRPLRPEEVPKIKEKPIEKKKEIEVGIDQMKEIEDERIKQAEKEIEETQRKAAALSKSKDFEPTSALSKSKDFEPTSALSKSKDFEPTSEAEEKPEENTSEKKTKKKKSKKESEKKED